MRLLSFPIAAFFFGWLIIATHAADNVPLKAPLKVGFVLIGPANDEGWNAAHNAGKLFLESKLKGKVITDLAENVPDNADCERVLEKMVASGDGLIFTTSYGFLEHAEHVAAKHPNVKFVHIERSSNSPLPNLSTCILAHWEPEFVAGAVAGKMTKTNHLGFVAAHAVPQVLQTINAFALGARSVNPQTVVHVVWTNTWSDPPLESESAKALIDQKADVLTMHENSPRTIILAADAHDKHAVGFHYDLEDLRPKCWLTGECWNWGPLYVDYAQSVIDGTWKPGNRRYGLDSHFLKLARFGPSVSPAIQKDARVLVDNIEKKKVAVFGKPLLDQSGKERVTTGTALTDSQIDSMDWLCQSVKGSIPQRH